MQIVVNIDKDVFERIKSGIPESVDCFKCEEAVLYGTPLPENHERLIDVEKVYQKAFEDIRAEIWDSGMNMTGEYQGVWIRYRDIEKIFDKHNPDKAESEDEG